MKKKYKYINFLIDKTELKEYNIAYKTYMIYIL